MLPLLAWSYMETTAAAHRFCRLLDALRADGSQPRVDLRAATWVTHKRYLLELQEESSGLDPNPRSYQHRT